MSFSFSFETKARPEQVVRALTDTSERRLQIWKDSLDPATYEVRGQGDSWAVIKEGRTGTKLWAVLRYEWDTSGVVRWSMVESNHCNRGTGLILVKPAATGGSRVEVEIDHREGWGLRGRTYLGVQRVIGPVAFPRMWQKALDRYAEGAE